MNGTYHIAWSLLRPRWPLVLFALGFSLLSASTNAGLAVLIGSLTEWLFHQGSTIQRLASSWWRPDLPRGLSVALGFGLVTSARVVGMLGTTWVTARLSTEIVHELRTTLYDRTVSNAMPRTLAHHRGEILARLYGDVEVIEGALTYTVSSLAHTIFSTLLVGGLVFSIDSMVGFACFLGAPLAAFVVRRVNRRFYPMYEKLRDDYGVLSSRIEEGVDMGDVIRSLGAEARMRSRFEELSARVQLASRRLAFNTALTRPLVSVSGALGVALLVAWWNLRTAPPPTDQAALIAAAAILIRPIHGVSDWYESLVAARASLTRVNEILATPDGSGQPERPNRRGTVNLLEAEQLSFSFHEREVLSQISFRLKRGQVLAIVGASGSGKTTLLRLVAGLLEPANGRLILDGTSAVELGQRAYRYHFGWVPQEARLLLDSIEENLRLGRPEATQPELLDALAGAGLGPSVLASFPAGLRTVVNDDGSPFSVGQRQRLCIARALVAQAPVLILDEPTAALDERQAEELHDTLEELRANVGVVIATHRLSSVKRSDWVLMLEEGRVVEEGPPGQMLRHGVRFRRLFAQDIVASMESTG